MGTLISRLLAATAVATVGVAVPAEAVIHSVDIGNFFFSPLKTQVMPGDTVRWVFVAGTHSTTSDPGSAKAWNSGIKTSGTWDEVFTPADGPGPFPYHCSVHPTMRDTIFWSPSADLDGDGFDRTVDCDDANPAISPGAFDVPNDGIDQNCDGVDAVMCFTDADGDGYGDNADPGTYTPGGVCVVGKVLIQGDCDDTDPTVPPCGCCVARGDLTGDGNVNVSDLTFLVNFLFKGGPAPACPDHGDANNDGNMNVADLTFLVNFLFKGGPAPAPC